MGKQWDTGETAFDPEFWSEVYRVLKPGAYVAAFGSSRSYHRMACAIEDAGFEIRDSLMWIYGTGFPKSHDVSKGIDRAAGAERQVIGTDRNFGKSRLEDGKTAFGDYAGEWNITAPSTDAARQWQGWGTALKPAFEPIVLARKPLSEKTVAANVMKWGTGAINIGECRVAANADDIAAARVPQPKMRPNGQDSGHALGAGCGRSGEIFDMSKGRWPANVCHDGSAEVVGMFPETNPAVSGKPRNGQNGNGWGMSATGAEYDDNGGSAARFFYSAKADGDSRAGSKHPTVKPVDLMQWLIRLITPKNGLVLDPFAGTGTTAEAALYEGMRCILVEKEDEYIDDIRRRLSLYGMGSNQRTYELAKLKPIDLGPLFAQ
jgi:site-specific DNA-methyltransferase (adenine-specific)